ncbi:hypothetical protein evm_005927 [Chilo suppressalis]|nr:hypothetical protein evm_005927 [Chilo suppressalis]
MSCVVKWCKNRSDRKKKNPGITFHRFPKENVVWRNDWIQIIRNCNSENEWIPSKYSVICSLHFEAEDLYSTKGGLRRVVTYAVPQKFLFENAEAQTAEEQPVPVPYISSASQESASMSVPALEQLCSSIMVLQQEEQPAEPNMSMVVQENASTILPAIIQPSPSIIVFQQEEQRDDSNICMALQEKPEVGTSEVLSMLYTSKKRSLKQSIIEKLDIIRRQKRQIKTLKQKTKRLQNRNKSLKEILKSLKEHSTD